MLFYSALHKVESVCADRNLHHSEHTDRNQFLCRHWPEVYRVYKRLRNESKKARYFDGGVFSLTADQVRKQLLEGAYPACIKAIENRRPTPLLGPDVVAGMGGATTEPSGEP